MRLAGEPLVRKRDEFLEIDATTILLPITITRRIKAAASTEFNRLFVGSRRLTRFGGCCRLCCRVGFAMGHGWVSGKSDRMMVDGQVARHGGLCALHDVVSGIPGAVFNPLGSTASRVERREDLREQPQNLNARGPI